VPRSYIHGRGRILSKDRRFSTIRAHVINEMDSWNNPSSWSRRRIARAISIHIYCSPNRKLFSTARIIRAYVYARIPTWTYASRTPIRATDMATLMKFRAAFYRRLFHWPFHAYVHTDRTHPHTRAAFLTGEKFNLPCTHHHHPPPTCSSADPFRKKSNSPRAPFPRDYGRRLSNRYARAFRPGTGRQRRFN